MFNEDVKISFRKCTVRIYFIYQEVRLHFVIVVNISCLRVDYLKNSFLKWMPLYAAAMFSSESTSQSMPQHFGNLKEIYYQVVKNEAYGLVVFEQSSK